MRIPTAKSARNVFVGLIAAAALATGLTPPVAFAVPAVYSAATPADTSGLKTWWHDNSDANSTSPVAAGTVRRSAFYDVKVATTAQPAASYDSFAYMSIPRSGKGKVGYSEEDGAEFSDSADLTMSWSTFEYSTDVWVDVTLKTGQTISSVRAAAHQPLGPHSVPSE